MNTRFTEQRLGLAWVRGNKWIWDEEVFGPKPDIYEDLPMFSSGGESKYDYIHPKMEEVSKEISRMITSKYWWLYELGRTEEEWKEWYMNGEGDIYEYQD